MELQSAAFKQAVTDLMTALKRRRQPQNVSVCMQTHSRLLESAIAEQAAFVHGFILASSMEAQHVRVLSGASALAWASVRISNATSMLLEKQGIVAPPPPEGDAALSAALASVDRHIGEAQLYITGLPAYEIHFAGNHPGCDAFTWFEERVYAAMMPILTELIAALE